MIRIRSFDTVCYRPTRRLNSRSKSELNGVPSPGTLSFSPARLGSTSRLQGINSLQSAYSGNAPSKGPKRNVGGSSWQGQDRSSREVLGQSVTTPVIRPGALSREAVGFALLTPGLTGSGLTNGGDKDLRRCLYVRRRNILCGLVAAPW
jgi:hypothetical protein